MAADGGDGGAAAKAFVDALYRKVLLSVKASNAVPSEDDGYHFHAKFSSAFSSRAASSGAKAQALVGLLTTKQRRSGQKGCDDSDNEDEEGGKLFDGPEPNAKITDFVDALLDEATKQLELFAKGGDSATAGNLRPLENKPLEFKKKGAVDKNDKEEQKNAGASTAKSAPAKHVHALRKPQNEFDETIDNSDAPFISKLREKVHALNDGAAMEVDEDDDSEEAQLQRRHPYYHEVRSLKYAEWQLEVSKDPYPRIPVEEASYLWVNSEETLLKMMESLSKPETRVIAVDLEHHSYRSYMGIVCLMQVSTAKEDFLVDTLVLRSKLQIMNNVFCDPAKVKVLHGSDMDILWLQRDLGLYVVNMFDTGQAARLLQYPRFSLAYLLKRHCSVDADKQYQLADWRVRPLDKNMVKYAREDTRYLLYIYDEMKKELLAQSNAAQSSLLFETLQNSSKLCLQVYDKPKASVEDAAPLLERLKGTVGLTAPSELQERVFTTLYLWRDRVAREEDESTGYVMPNHVLIKLTKQLPTRSDYLFRTCHPVPTFVRKHAHELTTMIAAEKAAFSTEQAKQKDSDAATPATSGAAVRTNKKKVWSEDGVEQGVGTGSNVLNTARSESETIHPAWTSGKRQAKCGAGEGESALAPGLLQLGGAAVTSAAPVDSKDASAASILQQVNEMVARVSFTVEESDIAEAAADVESSATSAPKADRETPAPPAVPQSIAETYHMPNRPKRRKVEGGSLTTESLASEVKDRAADFMQQIGMGDKQEQEQSSFDYAAASEQVSGAKLDLNAPVRAGSARGNKRNGGKRKQQSGGSYNPFVAIRGGAGAGAGDEEKTVKQPRKKSNHMPRSATFR